jgi:hypothetical protein
MLDVRHGFSCKSGFQVSDGGGFGFSYGCVRTFRFRGTHSKKPETINRIDFIYLLSAARLKCSSPATVARQRS